MSQRTTSLSLLVMMACLMVLLVQASSSPVWAQTDFSVKIYVSDGSGWQDSLVLAKATSAVNAIAGDSAFFVKEKELPPTPPSGVADVRMLDPGGLGGYGQGVGVDIRNLVSDVQSDEYRLSFRPSTETVGGVSLSWQSGLDMVGAGGFWLTYTDSNSVSQTVDMTTVTSFSTPEWLDAAEARILIGDGWMGRTFTLNEIAGALDSKGKPSKSENPKRKPTGSEATFTLTCDVSGANALYVEYSQALTDHFINSPFPIRTQGDKATKQTYSGVSIDSGDVVTIKVWGDKGKALDIKKWWWMNGTTILPTAKTGVHKGPVVPTQARLRYKMPNIHNIGEEVYAQAPVIADVMTPTTLGIYAGTLGQSHTDAKSKVYYRYVYTPKYKDLQKTLYDAKTSAKQSGGAASCMITNLGKAVTKGQKGLAPAKTGTGTGNRLLGEILVLKFNIAASQQGKAGDVGFGDLVYTNAGHPYDGKTITQIAKCADSALTCPVAPTFGTAANGLYLPDVDSLADFLEMLNGTFSGPFDSSHFSVGSSKIGGVGTEATGVKAIALVPYLKRTGLAIPAISNPMTMEELITAITPREFSLKQNYPNPFNPSTTIQFDLVDDAMVTLKVYNMLGEEVATLLDREEMTSGLNDVSFDASSMASGVYFYRLVAEGFGDPEEGIQGQTFTQVKKMMLVK